MTAQEARKRAEQAKDTRKTLQYNSVKRAINDAVMGGEFEVTLYNRSLLVSVIDMLKAEGFEVSISSSRNETDTKITW